MPLNKDDVKGGQTRGAPKLSREQAKAHVAAYRATGTLPSSTFADPIASLPVKHPAPLTGDPLQHGSRGGRTVKASQYTPQPPRTPGLLNAADRTPFRPAPPMGLDKAIGTFVGIRPSTIAKVVEHPLRAAEHNRKAFEESGYRSAPVTPTGLIVAGGVFGSPVSSSVAKKGAEKGLATAFTGGAAKDEAAALPTGAQELRDALAGKNAFPGMGTYEKVGAQLDNPSLGKSATELRAQQDTLYSQERSKRVAQAEHLMNTVGGEEGHRLAMQALKGELPKLDFTAGKELNRDNIPGLFQAVQDHPDLRPFERIRTRNALLKVFDGTTPQPSEIKLLGKVFGEADAKKLAGSVSLWKHFKGTAAELVNVPRALMSTLDMSALLRQNLVASITHPVITGRNIKPMLQAFKSEAGYQALEDAVVSSPNYETAKKVGLAVTDFEGGLSSREEAWYGANLAEKLTGGTHSPVRMSGRAYVGLLNKTRMDLFDHLVGNAGRPLNDAQMGDIAKAINSATGRGAGPKAIKGWLPALNTLFFSPRLLFSRLDYLNPINYTRLDPIARKEYIKGAIGLVGTMTTVLMLAKMAGAKVGVDPTSADFAKIKIGNTRIDLAGGFQQPIRLLAQIAEGHVTSSTTGKTLTLGPQGPGKLSERDIIQRFFEGKLAPVPGVVNDYLKGTDFQGHPFSVKNELYSHLSPLAVQDAIDTYRQGGPLAAVGSYGLSGIGVGVQTYGTNAEAAFKKQLKTIDAAVKSGQLDPARAAAAKRDLERVHYVQTHDTKENRRQFLIDSMHDQGYATGEINAALAQLHYDPIR